MKKIVLIDDHPIVRQGFSLIINHELDLSVVGEAEDTSSALELIKNTQPDLALIPIGNTLGY